MGRPSACQRAPKSRTEARLPVSRGRKSSRASGWSRRIDAMACSALRASRAARTTSAPAPASARAAS
jgi:hypothetical protein